jgi:hypothetical protein
MPRTYAEYPVPMKYWFIEVFGLRLTLSRKAKS